MDRHVVIFAVPILLAVAVQLAATKGDDDAYAQPADENVDLGAPTGAIVTPIQGLKALELHDSFNELHNGYRHQAIDIMQARGTPVHAVIDGIIRKLFWSKAGGNTIYEFDGSGNYCYYYAHLDRYADNLYEGKKVSRSEVIGYVGSTGDAASNAPHLHFAIYRLGSDKRWWKGTPVDPYPILVQVLRTRPPP
jgi:murein DD-endopeptidase MepM/ murein hydrolase activator NlpD